VKKVLISAALALAFFAAVFCFNAWVDPGNVLRSGAVNEQLAEITRSGRSAVDIDNYDGRAFLRYYIPILSEPFDTVVLGSSRGIQISSEMLGEDSFYNSCVTGAEIEDIAAIYEIYRSHGLAPKRVVIAFDAWFVDANKSDGRWASRYPDYYGDFCREAGIDARVPSRPLKRASDFLTLFSPSYFQASLDGFAARAARGPFTIESTEGDDSELGIVRSDGSYRYPLSYSEADDKTVRDRVNEALGGIAGGFADYAGVDPFKASLFEALVSMIEADGGEVVVLLPPYNPAVYDALMSDGRYSSVTAVEDYVRSFCNERGIALVGSFDPARAGVSASDFIDALHITEDATRRLVSEIPKG